MNQLTGVSPLGDVGVIAYFSDEAAAARFAASASQVAPGWLEDVVPAYASVGILFDPDRIGLEDVTRWVRSVTVAPEQEQAQARRFHRIPVCYEMGLDFDRIHDQAGLAADEVISFHLGIEYTVYAIGFVPGFPYLGYLPVPLCGVPRLASPRVRVEPGSVGVTGRQTGIYPLPRPGGWNLIGRTPLTIVDMADGFFPIRVGDRVRFERIDEATYRSLVGERLGSGVATLKPPAGEPDE